MKKQRLVYSTLLAILAAIFVAVPVLAAYIATLAVAETSGNSYTQLPIIHDFDVQYLVDENYIDADGLDTRVKTAAGTVLPHMLTDDKILFSTSILADSNTNLQFSTGNTSLSAFDIITGYGGKFTIPDTAALEPADDFELEMSGYINTTAGASKNLIYKSGAVEVNVSAAVDGTIEAEVTGTALSDTYYFPTGAGTTQNFTADPAVAHHLNVDDAPGAPDDATTTVYKTTAGGTEEFTTTASGGSLQAGDTVNSVTVYFRAYGDGGDDNSAELRPVVRLGASSTTGSAFACTGTWTTRNQALARPGGGSWTVADLATLQIGVSKSGATEDCWVTQIYAVINYTPVRTLSAAAVTSGDHTVKLWADGTDIGLIVDEGEAGEVSDTTALDGATVVGNANSWIIADNSTTQFISYLDFYYHTVNSILIASYEPVDIIINTSFDGTADAGGDVNTLIDAALTQANDYWNLALVTITDTTDDLAPKGETAIVLDFADATNEVTLASNLTAGIDAGDTYTIEFGTLVDETNANDARITWGVNPTGISSTLGSFTSTSQPSISGGVINEPIQDVVSESSIDYTADTGTLTTNPIYSAILMVSTNTGFSVQQVWLMLAMFTTTGAMLAVFSFVPHQILTVIVGAAVTGVWVTLTVFPFWVLFVFVVMGIAVLLWERVQSVG